MDKATVFYSCLVGLISTFSLYSVSVIYEWMEVGGWTAERQKVKDLIARQLQLMLIICILLVLLSCGPEGLQKLFVVVLQIMVFLAELGAKLR